MYYIWKLIRFFVLKPMFFLLGRYNKEYFPKYNRSNITGRNHYVMNTDYDCETVAIMTETYGLEDVFEKDENDANYYRKCEYDRVNNALLRCDCLGWLQNPIYGNPWNVRITLEELGYIVENVEPKDIDSADMSIILIHWHTGGLKHLLFQHWISHIYGDSWNFGDGHTHTVDKEQLERYWRCRLYATCYRIHKIHIDNWIEIK